MNRFKYISQSAKLDIQYNGLLAEVAKFFRVKYAIHIGISESKASRVLNKKQKDLDVLAEMASFVGLEVNLTYKTIDNN